MHMGSPLALPPIGVSPTKRPKPGQSCSQKQQVRRGKDELFSGAPRPMAMSSKVNPKKTVNLTHQTEPLSKSKANDIEQ